MGAVVGHEMTHGFIDKGRRFNFAGVLEDWWSEADATEYEKRVQVMVEQANAFEVHGSIVQGKLTSGENIVDLGGLRLAFRALKSKEGFDDIVVIDGFTPAQRLFLAWAQCLLASAYYERTIPP
jgi:putative endopeptidase